LRREAVACIEVLVAFPSPVICIKYLKYIGNRKAYMQAISPK